MLAKPTVLREIPSHRAVEHAIVAGEQLIQVHVIHLIQMVVQELRRPRGGNPDSSSVTAAEALDLAVHDPVPAIGLSGVDEVAHEHGLCAVDKASLKAIP